LNSLLTWIVGLNQVIFNLSLSRSLTVNIDSEELRARLPNAYHHPCEKVLERLKENEKKLKQK
jgi:hypothetical protein